MAATACGERDARTVQRSVDRLLLLHPGHHHGDDGEDVDECEIIYFIHYLLLYESLHLVTSNFTQTSD